MENKKIIVISNKQVFDKNKFIDNLYADTIKHRANKHLHNYSSVEEYVRSMCGLYSKRFFDFNLDLSTISKDTFNLLDTKRNNNILQNDAKQKELFLLSRLEECCDFFSEDFDRKEFTDFIMNNLDCLGGGNYSKYTNKHNKDIRNYVKTDLYKTYEEAFDLMFDKNINYIKE